MDLVIFTGRLPDHELKDERPVEYARLVQQGRLAALEAPAPTAGEVGLARAIGTVGLVLGILTVLIIIYSALL
jgi:hypothetical protein